MKNRIRELRTAAGFSREDFAAIIKTTPSNLSRLETGKRRLNEDWIQIISDALKVPVALLFAETVRSPLAGTYDERLQVRLREATEPSLGMVELPPFPGAIDLAVIAPAESVRIWQLWFVFDRGKRRTLSSESIPLGLCLAHVDSQWLLRYIQRSDGGYLLSYPGCEPTHAAQIDECFAVEWIRPVHNPQ